VASPGDTNSTVVGSVFGGSGTIAALGSVYAMATRGIREATIDHARLRMVLTAFATQLGQLRAYAERPPDKDHLPDVPDITALNEAIGAAMVGALQLVPSPLAPVSEDDKTVSGDSHDAVQKEKPRKPRRLGPRKSSPTTPT
jgi:hypothetical protein